MKRRKLAAAVLAATLTMGLLSGCGSSASDAGNTAETKSETTESAEKESNEKDVSKAAEPCEITFWHAMSGQQEESLQKLTDQFNSENEDGITVTLVNQGYYNDLQTKLTANAAADTLPDMAQAYNNWLTPYLDKVVHLDDFVSEDYDNYDDIIESYRDECSEFGFVSALPFNKSTYVYFYNKTLFDELGLEAPQTWEDIENVGKVCKEKKDLTAVGFDDLTGMLEASLKQDGSEFITADGVRFDNEKGLETLTYILDMYKNGYAKLVGEDGYFSTTLSNQMIGSYVGSSTGVSYIDTSAGWELGVAPLPGNSEKAANQAGTNLVMFSKDENKQKAAWEYMKFLTSKEATTQWAMETGYLPIRTSAYESDEYQNFMSTDITATSAYAQSDAFFCSPTFDGSYDVRTTVNDKMEEFILNGTDPKTAMSELVDAINAQLK